MKGCAKYIHLFHQRPGCITPAEFLYYIKKRLNSDNDHPVKRLVFWDLTQIDYRFPMFYDDKMFIPALMDTFKFDDDPTPKPSPYRGMRSLIMGAANAHYTKAVSAMADNVIYCWRETIKVADGQEGINSLYKESFEKVKLVTGPKKDDPALKKHERALDDATEALFLYVDRREKSSPDSKGNLYAFPVINGRLMLPSFNEWIPDMFCIDNKYQELEPRLPLTKTNISKVRQQQGLE